MQYNEQDKTSMKNRWIINKMANEAQRYEEGFKQTVNSVCVCVSA